MHNRLCPKCALEISPGQQERCAYLQERLVYQSYTIGSQCSPRPGQVCCSCALTLCCLCRKTCMSTRCSCQGLSNQCASCQGMISMPSAMALLAYARETQCTGKMMRVHGYCNPAGGCAKSYRDRNSQLCPSVYTAQTLQAQSGSVQRISKTEA